MSDKQKEDHHKKLGDARVRNGEPRKYPKQPRSVNQAARDNGTVVSALTQPTQAQPPVQQVNQVVAAPAQATPSVNTAPPASDLRQALQTNQAARNAHGSRSVHMAVTYNVSRADQALRAFLALLDRGSNGGVLGSDAKVISTSQDTVHVTGVGDASLRDLPIVTAIAYVQTKQGPIIAVFNQYANLGRGKTIHSALQLEAFGAIVDDKARRLGGGQMLKHPEGYEIPLGIQ